MEIVPDLETALRRSKTPVYVPAGLPCEVTAFTLRGNRLGDVTVGFAVPNLLGSVTTIRKKVMWSTSPRAGAAMEPIEVQLERAKEVAQGTLMPEVDLAAAAWAPAQRSAVLIDGNPAEWAISYNGWQAAASLSDKGEIAVVLVYKGTSAPYVVPWSIG